MTVYGDGKQTRSFQYVSDLVWKIYIFSLLLPIGWNPLVSFFNVSHVHAIFSLVLFIDF